MGTSRGQGVPFTARSTEIACLANQVVPIDVPFEKAIKTNDAPVHLGWYFGVLATEYKLLKKT